MTEKKVASKALDQGVDKLTRRSDDDGVAKGAAKDALGGVAKGAAKGAAAGGAHGAVAGAAKGAGEALIRSKDGRKLVVALAAIPVMAFFLAILFVVSISTAAMNSESLMASNGKESVAVAADDEDGLERATENTAAPWWALYALYQVSENQGSTLEVPANHDGGGVTQLDAGLGDKCADWPSQVGQYLHQNWPDHSIGCQRDDADSDHNTGHALDWMLTPGEDDELGDEVATWLMGNAKSLGIKYLIWKQHIWNPTRDAYGVWRKMESRGTVSADHYDHIHISFTTTPGTYDLTTEHPEIAEADVEAAFGGEGSGGAVAGYEEFTASGEAYNPRPFGLLEDAPNAPESNDIAEVGAYLGDLFVDALRAHPEYNNQDIAEGLIVDAGEQIAVKEEGQRERIEAMYADVFKSLPVDGHTSDVWASNVVRTAIALRMGVGLEPCQPTGYSVSSGNASADTPSDFTPFTITSTSGYAGGPPRTVNVDERVIRNVAIVSAVAKDVFPTQEQFERAMVIAVSTMMVESGGLNLASEAVPGSEAFSNDGVAKGDYDSVGIFQQRLNYYGTIEQLMDPYYQAYMFFGDPQPLHGELPSPSPNRGLLKQDGWMSAPIGEVAQSIQVSAHPGRYSVWVDSVPQVIEAATGVRIDSINPGGCIGSMDALTGGAAMGIVPASGNVVSPIPEGVSGVITSARYGRYPSGGKHFGLDLSKGGGFMVQAVCDGPIKSIKINPRYANSNAYGVRGSTNYLWQDCGNNVLVGYAHFFARDLNADLAVGVNVGAGTPLFPQGNQGNSSGAHLHLQISTSGSTAYSRESTVDPAAYLAQFGVSLPPANY